MILFRLLCVRIEIDQLYCVNVGIIYHCLSVLKFNADKSLALRARHMLCLTTDLQTVIYLSTIHY